MKEKFTYIFLLLALLLVACTPGSIKVNLNKENNTTQELQTSFSDSLKLIWETELTGNINSPMIIRDKYGFINDLSGRVYCIDLTTSKLLGNVKVKGFVHSKPIINGDFLYFAAVVPDGEKSYFYSYDLSKGKEIEEIEIQGFVKNDLIFHLNHFYLLNERGKLFKYNLNGDKVFENDADEFTHSGAYLIKDLIIYGTDKGKIISVDINSGKQRYNLSVGKNSFSSLLVANEKIFAVNEDGNLYIINILNGTLEDKIPFVNKVYAKMSWNEGKLYIPSTNGILYIMNIDDKKIEQINLKGSLSSEILITDNFLYVPDLQYKLHIIETKTKEIKSLQLPGRGRIKPEVYEGKLLVGYDRGRIALYEIINY